MGQINIEEVNEAIVSSFKTSDFRRLLDFRFRVDLEEEAPENATKKDAVYAIVKKAEDEGWLPELIAEIARERPKRNDVQEVYRRYAAALVSDLKKAQVDASVRAAYSKFFGDKRVNIQIGGDSEAIVPKTDAGLERTVRETLGFFDVGRWLGRFASQAGRVCRVELNDANGIMGTGFLVGPDALLTNYHVFEKVIKGDHPADLVRFRFDYRTQADGTPSDGKLIELASPADPKEWLLGRAPYSDAEKTNNPDVTAPTADQLDYALVRLARKIGDERVTADGSTRGWIFVPEAQLTLGGLPALMILQHPQLRRDRQPEPLMLAFDTNPQVELKYGGLRVRYATNTEGGSSGSPCFNKDWDLIALHHYGDPAVVEKPKFNQGIPIGKIREHLRANGAEGALGSRI